MCHSFYGKGISDYECVLQWYAQYYVINPFLIISNMNIFLQFINKMLFIIFITDIKYLMRL